jgi:hypothetical protein
MIVVVGAEKSINIHYLAVVLELDERAFVMALFENVLVLMLTAVVVAVAVVVVVAVAVVAVVVVVDVVVVVVVVGSQKPVMTTFAAVDFVYD